jgi:choice-of-anchor B domain-containing protein
MLKPLLLLLAALPATLFSQNFNATFRSKMSFPGQTAANICGYAANGREYALVGGSAGLIIVDVTKPDAPVKLAQLPGPNNLWKEIKTYKHYAYVTSEGGQGVQIVDMSKLPDPNPTYKFYTGNGDIANQLSSIHALHIDTTKGFLYAYGSGLFSGGAVVLNLKDPWSPVYAGHFDQLGYIHDGWVDNDTLYAGHIYMGSFSVVDMRDKAKPVVLGLQRTPQAFTHNTWMSRDRRVIFATDEVDDSSLSAFDISDPQDIRFLDKVKAQPGSNSMVHNTHILGDYAVTSWYSSGVSIVDVSRPDNLVQTGLYDVAPAWEGGGSEGCWGVYPYLPSGTLLASIISGTQSSNTGELWVLTPNYQRAAYLEGVVKNAVTANPIASAVVELLNGRPGSMETTDANGLFKTGQAGGGTVQVKVSAPGYITQTLEIALTAAEVTPLNVLLQPEATVAVSGKIVAENTNAGIPYAKVVALGPLEYETQADAAGNFLLPAVTIGKYTIAAGQWGYGYVKFTNQNLMAPQTYTLKLPKGYQDDFVTDYGWEVSGTSITGVWERAKPVGVNPGLELAPDKDLNGDIGDKCYVTGNKSSEVGEDCVKDGTMILTSPVMDLTTYNDPIFRSYLYFTHFNQNNQSLDSIKIYVENGLESKLLFQLSGSTLMWQSLLKKIKPVIALTKTMRISIQCYNKPSAGSFNSYEASFDGFRILEGSSVGTEEAFDGSSLRAWPNPFGEATTIAFQTPDQQQPYTLRVYDVTGRCVETLSLSPGQGTIQAGEGLQAGIYWMCMEQAGLLGPKVKLVKTQE